MTRSKTTKTKRPLSQQEARNLCWTRGIFPKAYLRHSQLQVCDFIQKQPRPFLEAARRWGKTTTILAYVLNELSRHENWIARICLPEKEQARKVWMPEIDKIQAWAPDSHKMRFRTIDTVYLHPNGSRMYLHGINDDQGKGARGSASHIVVADEFGFWRYPEALKEVLAPQTRTTNGKIVISSTPSKDLGHAYYTEKKLAIRDGRFIQRVIFDDETLFDPAGNCLDKATYDQIIADCGGMESSVFKREYLCQEVADPESLVIPEFDEKKHVVESYTRPPFFDIYVGADLGFHDKTAMLFGFYDFERATLVIEDELVVSGWNSRQITDRAKQIEYELYGSERRPYLRVSDNDHQQLYDMATMCGYQLVPTQKDDKEAAVNALRLRFSEQKGKIRIAARCKNFIYQLKVGMWNEAKKSFLRGEETGHLDTLDAAIYLNRNVNTTKNPYPAPVYDLQGHFINPDYQSPLEGETKGLESLLPLRGFQGT